MSNPFPGMNPYLEGGLWTSVHSDLVSEIARQLAPKLQPKYLAFTTRRIVLARPDGEDGILAARLPDVGVLDSGYLNGGGGVAIAPAPLVLEAPEFEEIPHLSVEIRDAEHRRLVTSIEVLSPTNKLGDGAAEYRTKRRQMLKGSAHLVEVDLLRSGERFPTTKRLPDAPYFVFVSRHGQRPNVDTWPIAMESPLPDVPVPLLPGDADSSFGLQAALTTIHAIFPYNLAVNYAAPPPGPLTPEQAAWVDKRLRQKGKRPT